MHRIDHPTADPNANGVGKAGFTEGNPSLGTPATVVTDDWLNDVQENIMAVLEAAGIAPIKGTFTQLRDAIVAIAASSAGLWNDGTAAAPGARFSADTDTGIFRPGANRMGVSTGGVQVAEWESDGRYKAIKPGYAPEVALDTSGSTIPVDLATGNNFGGTLAAAKTLGTPSNQKIGQNGVIAIRQNGTGGWTLSYAAGWTGAWENGDEPVMPTDPDAEMLIVYHVSSTGLRARYLSNFG